MPPADWMQAAQTGLLQSMHVIIAAISAKSQLLSVPEVPDSGKNHGASQAVRGLDHLGVADRATGLNNGRGAGLGDGFKAIREREKGIGGGHGPFQGKNSLHCAQTR